MFLTDEQILSCTYGIVDHIRTPSGFTFRRVTKKQIAAFTADALFPNDPPSDRNFFRDNALYDAGVMQDFITDSTFVTFHIPLLELGWMKAPMQVFVDGREEAVIDAPGRHTVALTGKSSRVQLFYSYVGRAVLRSVEVADGAAVTPAPKKGLWLFIGDSITHGVCAGKAADIYANRIARDHDWECINQGNAGYFHDAAIVDGIGDRTPDVITVAYGTNDLFRMPMAENRAHMIDFYRALTAQFPASKIFALSPIWRHEWDDETLAPAFDDMYRLFDEVIGSFPGVTLIDGRDLVPHTPLLFADGLHPTSEGFVYYADRLYRAVTEKL